MAHVMVLDSDDDIFVCGLCKSVFNSLQIFLDHKNMKCNNLLNNASTSSVYTSQPGAVFNASLDANVPTLPQVNDSKAATRSEAWTSELICKLCGKKFKKSKTLILHMKSHNGKTYQCPICGRCFLQNSHLQRHIISHKVWPDGLSETTAKTPEVELLSYSCSYCNLTLCNYRQFRIHLKSHITLKKYKCIQGGCMSFFDTLDNLLTHVSVAHVVSVYTCYICNENFNCLESIAAHQQSHNEYDVEANTGQLKHYKCLQCDATFKKYEKLSLHMLTENHKKVCIHCNKSFASDKRLRLHLQIHRQSKPFQCNMCSSSFHMKKYLTSHMLKHGKRQFECSVCKYMFKRQDLLQRHMRLHQLKSMYQCPFRDTLDCKKEFSRRDKLQSHVQCHTKKKPVKPITEENSL